MNTIFDTRQVRRSFSRSAAGYDAAARLQREVRGWMLETLAFYDDPVQGRPPPTRVLDLGSGPAHAALAIAERWPKAQVLALDLALPMLQQARIPRRGLLRRGPDIHRLCADARALPLAAGSLDIVFSNLCLQWVDDLPATLAGLRRVLRPGGLLLFSTFGPDTLVELRDAFAAADQAPHVSPFAAIAQVGDALVHAGFRDPVVERDVLTTTYPDLPALMRELRALGATNALQGRRQSLTGKARFAAAARAYEQWRRADGRLPARWEVITAMAWAPQAGQPIRQGGVDVASIPVDSIPIRRR
ncbi:MAG: malonyl-ACP O-methyltransferase BioC [Pseudoxanthomonas suwonensis]|nr:malonyl-ACP O-methyltransferase BioC [Pseudoxanthomonas suwonensis]